jgi:hypothetical protein
MKIDWRKVRSCVEIFLLGLFPYRSRNNSQKANYLDADTPRVEVGWHEKLSANIIIIRLVPPICQLIQFVDF